MAGAQAQARSRAAGLRSLALLAALAPTTAHAGAWIAPKGGQEIWTNVAGTRDEVSFYESSGYLEAPIGGQSSLVIAPWGEQNYDTIDGWKAEAIVGLKRVLFHDEEAQRIMAVQVSGLWVSHPPDECGESGGEVRWLGGANLGETGFVNVELGGRMLEGGCESARFDLTAGYRPRENWLALAQVFSDVPEGGEDAVRLQLSLVRFGDSGRGIQVGLRTRIDGGGGEPALVLGFWGRPGE